MTTTRSQTLPALYVNIINVILAPWILEKNLPPPHYTKPERRANAARVSRSAPLFVLAGCGRRCSTWRAALAALNGSRSRRTSCLWTSPASRTRPRLFSISRRTTARSTRFSTCDSFSPVIIYATFLLLLFCSAALPLFLYRGHGYRSYGILLRSRGIAPGTNDSRCFLKARPRRQVYPGVRARSTFSVALLYPSWI